MTEPATGAVPDGEVTALLQAMIANACVNDGTDASGQEVRNAELLADYLDVPGIEMESFEPMPGRRSLAFRLARAPGAPGTREKTQAGRAPLRTLILMGHTDVVPVEAAEWREDPFGGELIDGWVWGRGAVDMLNLTASMAVAMRRVAMSTRSGPLRGDLVFLAVADEEALGRLGAQWLVANRPDVVAADGVVTESGGVPVATPSGIKLPVVVAEKGSHWCRISVRGTPGHGSRPYRCDSALLKAAEVVCRLAEFRSPVVVPSVWRRFVEGLELDGAIGRALIDPDALDGTLDRLPDSLAREAHASTRTTFAPTICHCGDKINVIPGHAEIQVDIRVVPGQTSADVRSMISEALADLETDVEVTPLDDEMPSESAVDTPLWESLSRVATSFYQGSATLPMLSVGATDARFFRHAGVPSYGFGLFSRKMSLDQYAAMFHGNDERVDVESLALSTRMWEALAEDFLG